MAREGRGMRRAASACAALAALAWVPGRAAAQMAADAWSTDPATTVQAGGNGPRFRSGPDFPLRAYGAIGSSLAGTGHFTEVGLSEAQVGALLDGMRAAFQGRPVALDDEARRLLADVGRRAAGPVTAHAGAGPEARADFPLPECAAIGSFLAQSGHLAELGWSEAQVGAFLDGVGAALRGKPVALDEGARQLLADIGRQIGDIEELRRLEAPRSLDPEGRLDWYMRRVCGRLGLQRSDSGLAYRVEPGRGGVRPRPGDTVVFTCTAIAADGATKLEQMSGERVRTKMDTLLPGLVEGLQMMTIDGSAVFVLPPKLSFGDNPWPDGVPRGAPIIFTVTLHDVAARQGSP